MESCPWWRNASAAVRWSFFRDLADTAADVCINCFGGGDEDLEAVRQKVDKKKKLNKKPAQVAGKKMAGKGVKKKASASNRAASKETASAANRAMLK